MTDSILVWGGAEGVACPAGDVLCWQTYTEEGSASSIPKYLERHSDRLREKYLRFIHDLGQSYIFGFRVVDHLDQGDGFSFWWMNQLAEKSPFKSPQIYDCLRLMALEEILRETRPLELTATGVAEDVAQAIGELCDVLQINFVLHAKGRLRKRRWSFRRLYLALPFEIQSLISLRHLVAKWPLRNAKPRTWISGDRVVTLFSYFFNLELKACAEGKFYSRQWEKLPEFIQGEGWRVNWIHHFLRTPGNPNVRQGADWLSRFNQEMDDGNRHAFIEAYLSVPLIFRAIKAWLRLNLVYWRLRSIRQFFRPQGSALSLWPLLKNDWKTSLKGPVALQNCLWTQFFDAALKDMPHQKVGLYLWENQGWESALIHAWRRHGHGKIIGIPHATTAYWHLNNFDDKRSLLLDQTGAKPLPDYLALNGPMAWKAFSGSEYPIDHLVEVEATRFQYLLAVDRQAKSVEKRLPIVLTSERNLPKKLLILGDFSVGQTLKMLRCVKLAVDLIITGVSLTLKPHPACKISKDDCQDLALEMTFSPLAKIIHEYDLAFASNTTSAALDALLAGLPVVVFLDGEDFNHSPLRGISGVRFIGQAEDLASALVSDEPMLDRPAPSEFFWLDQNFSRWHRLLSQLDERELGGK